MNEKETFKPLPKRLFDALRWTQITLGGIAAAYLTIAQIWGLPFGPQISGTCAALSTLIGLYLKVDTAFYFNQEDPKNE